MSTYIIFQILCFYSYPKSINLVNEFINIDLTIYEKNQLYYMVSNNSFVMKIFLID